MEHLTKKIVGYQSQLQKRGMIILHRIAADYPTDDTSVELYFYPLGQAKQTAVQIIDQLFNQMCRELDSSYGDPVVKKNLKNYYDQCHKSARADYDGTYDGVTINKPIENPAYRHVDIDYPPPNAYLILVNLRGYHHHYYLEIADGWSDDDNYRIVVHDYLSKR